MNGAEYDPRTTARTDPLAGSFPLYAGEKPRELQVLMDATNRCNLRCVMCHFAYDSSQEEPLKQWSKEFLERVEHDVFPFAGHVQVSTGTEPLMWRHFPLLLDALRRAKVPVFEMITNAQLITEELAQKIVASGMTRVQISLEAATREIYDTVRAGGDFDRFRRGVEALAAAKVAAGSPLPHLQFNITLLRGTADQVEGVLQYAHEQGVRDLDFRHVVLLDDLGMESQSFLGDREGYNRLMDRTRERAAELGLEVVMAPENFPSSSSPTDAPPPERERTAPPSIPASVTATAEAEGFPIAPVLPGGAACSAPWRQTYIAPNGQVLPCPFWYTKEPIGDLREQAFLDIWEGASYRRLRWDHLTGQYQANCERCPLRGKGRVENGDDFFAHVRQKIQSPAPSASPPFPSPAPAPPAVTRGPRRSAPPEYVSCRFIESGLVLSHKDLKFCCLPHSDCTKGYVPICDYHGGSLPVERIREMRRRLVEMNNREGTVTPCTGCGHLSRQSWPAPEGGALFDWVGVDSFFRCNLRCCYCDTVIHEDWELPDSAYDLLSVFRELIEGGHLAPGARVEWGGGEPSILEDFDAIENLLLEHDVHQLINTNAVRHSPPIARGLELGRTEIVTSVDAGNAETFAAIKGKDRFERVWTNLAAYAKTGGEVTAKYIVRRGNSDPANVLSFVRRCAEAGIRRISLSPDLEEVSQNDLTEESAYAFALLDHEARRRGIEVYVVSEYLPDDRQRLLKYMPLRRFEWRYWATRKRDVLRRASHEVRRTASSLLHSARTFEAIRRANTCMAAYPPDPAVIRDLLDRQVRHPHPGLRSRLVELVLRHALPGKLSDRHGEALGLTSDFWTLNGEPCYLIFDNRSFEEAFTPALRLGCFADATDLPLTVTATDGAHDDVVHTYYQAERRRVELATIPAGESAIVAIRTDRSWHPRGGEDHRCLGVNVELEPRDSRAHLAT